MTRSYQVNDTYSVYNDIMHCFGCETEPNDFLRIHYKVTHMCGDINCPEHVKEVRLQSRVLPIYESSSIVDGKGHGRDIAQLQKIIGRGKYTCANTARRNYFLRENLIPRIC